MSVLAASKPSLPTSLTLLSVLTLATILLHHHARPVTPTKCVLYDRPPRTGSTTISTALTACMRHKDYAIARNRDGRRANLISNLLRSRSARLAAVRTHVALSARDVAALNRRCGALLYVTSCAPMSKRLFSALKYGLTEGHGNSSLGRAELARLKLAGWTEAFLEAYPHVTEGKRPLAEMPERRRPDYVIRAGSVGEDLGKLLGALGCAREFRSENVHVVEDQVKMRAVEVKLGDRVYKWLMEVAEANAGGLRKARAF